MTSCNLRCRKVWCAVTEAFVVEFSQGVEDVFVETVNLTNPIRQLAGSGH
jgi:hypothetical protein